MSLLAQTDADAKGVLIATVLVASLGEMAAIYARTVWHDDDSRGGKLATRASVRAAVLPHARGETRTVDRAHEGDARLRRGARACRRMADRRPRPGAARRGRHLARPPRRAVITVCGVWGLPSPTKRVSAYRIQKLREGRQLLPVSARQRALPVGGGPRDDNWFREDFAVLVDLLHQGRSSGGR